MESNARQFELFNQTFDIFIELPRKCHDSDQVIVCHHHSDRIGVSSASASDLTLDVVVVNVVDVILPLIVT